MNQSEKSRNKDKIPEPVANCNQLVKVDAN